MELTTEYLMIIEKKTSEALFRLCDTVEAFNKFLQTEPRIQISKNRITFLDRYTFAYRVKTGVISGKEQRYFHIKLSTNGEEDILTQFTDLNRVIRRLVHDSNGQPETLWNDVSLFYSQQSYPYIHHIENLMRKLITYFMLTTVGKEWVAEASPSAVKEAIDKSKRKQYLDVLYQVDFKHLGDFLFKEYETRSTAELYERLDGIQNLNELTLDELRSFRARSNWDRYFSGIVECDGAYLDKRWKQLYELRCMVAHNALIGSQDYDSIVRLVSEVGAYLQRALDNLDRIHLPDEDKEQVAENVVSNISAGYGEFIRLWKSLESVLNRMSTDLELETTSDVERFSTRQVLGSLSDNELIDKDLYEEAIALSELRNILVHDASVAINEQEIESYIRRLENLITTLKAISKPVSFHDECIVRLEHQLKLSLVKQSRTMYKSQDGEIALTCAVSKAHERGDQSFYWFGFHRYHKQFLDQAERSYAAFGCGSERTIVLIPFSKFSDYLSYMSVTDRDNRYYWHVHIVQNDGNLLLQRSGANPIDLSEFLLPHDSY